MRYSFFGAIGSALAHRLESRKIPITASLFVGTILLGLATITPKYLAPVLITLYVGYFYIVKVLFNSYLQREVTDKNRATMTSVNSLVSETFALVVFGVFALTAVPNNYTRGLQVMVGISVFAAVFYGLLSKKYNLHKAHL